jgi:hypothetical protein
MTRLELEAIILEEIQNVLNEKKKSGSKSLHNWFKKDPDGSGPKKKGGWVDCNTCRKDKKSGRRKCKPCGRKKGEKRSLCAVSVVNGAKSQNVVKRGKAT